MDGVFTGLPAQLQPPARVADLPSDHAVGQAALMYHEHIDTNTYDPNRRTFEQKDVYLVTRSGEHFRVGRTPEQTGPLDLSLSPDGRWLGSKRDGRWRVRDLSGVAEYEVPDGYVLWLWSTDAGSVLLVKPSVGDRTFATMALPGGGVRLLDMRTPDVATQVAFVAGRELALFDPTPSMKASRPAAGGEHHAAGRDHRRDPEAAGGRAGAAAAR